MIRRSLDLKALKRTDTSLLGPEEAAKKLATFVEAALTDTGVFQVVEVQVAVGQIHVLGRVGKEDEKTFVEEYGFPMQEAASKNGILQFGTTYFKKGGAKKYAWTVVIGSDDLYSTVTDVCSSLSGFYEDEYEEPKPPSSSGVTVVPMLGGPERSATPDSGHRGVSRTKG